MTFTNGHKAMLGFSPRVKNALTGTILNHIKGTVIEYINPDQSENVPVTTNHLMGAYISDGISLVPTSFLCSLEDDNLVSTARMAYYIAEGRLRSDTISPLEGLIDSVNAAMMEGSVTLARLDVIATYSVTGLLRSDFTIGVDINGDETPIIVIRVCMADNDIYEIVMDANGNQMGISREESSNQVNDHLYRDIDKYIVASKDAFEFVNIINARIPRPNDIPSEYAQLKELGRVMTLSDSALKNLYQF